jgi:predicted O-methyltransferase YrrM
MNLLDRAKRFARIQLGIKKLKREATSHLDDPAELVAVVSRYRNNLLKPIQIPGELAALVRDVRRLKPQRVLEIGTANGGTLFLWTQLAQPNATIVSIDLPGGKFGGGYTVWQGITYRRFANKNQKLHLLREDSHTPAALEKTRRLFKGEPLDMLFIDGDHTYEGVKKDWEMYSPLVRPGGMIAFHDIAGNYDDTQVKRLWDSIKTDFEHQEYVLDANGYYGLGLLSK